MIRRTVRLGAVAGTLVSLAIGLVLAALSLSEPLPVLGLRNIVFDSFQRAHPRAFAADMPVRIIDIDDESLARYGQWPWPRTLIARLVEVIGAENPAVIGLDIVFAEPDRTSPERLLPALPPSPERDALIARLDDTTLTNDRILADTLKRHRSVSGLVMTASGAAPPVVSGIASAGDPPQAFVPRFGGAVAPLEALQPAFAGFGALNWLPEYDQVVRRVPTLFASGEALVPSFAVEVLRVAQQAAGIVIKASNASGEWALGRTTGIIALKIGDLVLRTDADGALRLRFSGSTPQRRIAAWKLLEPDAGPQGLGGRIVLVGSSAAALADLRATPLDPAIPGVEVHAEILEHALSGTHLARPDWAPGGEALFTFLGAMIAGLAAYHLVPLLATAVCFALAAAAVAGAWGAFNSAGLLLDPVLPALAVGLGFLVVSIARWKASDSERKAVRSAFVRYLSPAMVERLAQSPGQLKLGGEQRQMTVLFADVRGFTALSEGFRNDPQGLTAVMNRLLTPLSEAIIAEDGTIDKYMGDAVMAFWNAPLDVPDHADAACRAALSMQTRLAALNAELRAEAEASGRTHTTIDIGVGINTGLCTVGNMGSALRFDYSVLGDAVNLASRLQGLSAAYGAHILVGEATVAALKEGFATIEVDLARARGHSQPTRIYALVGDRTVANTPEFIEKRTIFLTALTAYRHRDWAAALQILSTPPILNDRLIIRNISEKLIERLRRYQILPPPAGWDGVHDPEAK